MLEKRVLPIGSIETKQVNGASDRGTYPVGNHAVERQVKLYYELPKMLRAVV